MIANSDSRRDTPTAILFFFFSFDSTISLIKDLGLIGSRGGCPTGRKGEKRWIKQEEKDRHGARRRDEPRPTYDF